MGFLVEEESEPLTGAVGGELSKGLAKVENTGMVLGDKQLNSMEIGIGYFRSFD